MGKKQKTTQKLEIVRGNFSLNQIQIISPFGPVRLYENNDE